MLNRQQTLPMPTPALHQQVQEDASPHDHTLIDITTTITPDPFLIVHASTFHLTFTANSHIPLWSSPSLPSFASPSSPNNYPPLWTPPPSLGFERFWAPELHAISGKWYIYFAAAFQTAGNKSHRTYVLSGPDSSPDPRGSCPDDWEFKGMLEGMDQRQWAIDGTVFEYEGRGYLVYSGWPGKEEGEWEGRDERVQELWIYELDGPTRVKRGPVRISEPDREWECLGDVGINEGPQWLERPGGGWRGLVHSAGPSWTEHYKMATLELVGDDPMEPGSWRKGERPLLQNRPDGKGPFAPGHGSFLHINGKTFSFFHAIDDKAQTRNRTCRMQRVYWNANGPDMGGYVGDKLEVSFQEYIKI